MTAGTTHRLRLFVASFACAVALAGQSLPALHFVLVTHTRCDEHGELVHGTVRQEAPTTSTHRAAVQFRHAHEEHDHCGSAPVRPCADALVRRIDPQPPMRSQPQRFEPPPNTAIALRAISILQIAPKGSPPRSSQSNKSMA